MHKEPFVKQKDYSVVKGSFLSEWIGLVSSFLTPFLLFTRTCPTPWMFVNITMTKQNEFQLVSSHCFIWASVYTQGFCQNSDVHTPALFSLVLNSQHFRKKILLEQQSCSDWEVIQNNLKYELLTHLRCLSRFLLTTLCRHCTKLV